jgi:CBS domain containing-hemolysin-like protein
MKALELYPLEDIDHLIYPDDMAEVDKDSSALLILTDFKLHQPFVIEASTPLGEAEKLMLRAHVKLKLVVNKSGEFRGIISHADLGSQHTMPLISQGYSRQDLTVEDLMTSRRDLAALGYRDLEGASIGQIVHTLQENGVQHCLVVDRNEHTIRGLVSASDIARRLHLPVNIQRTPTFVDIFHAVRG